MYKERKGTGKENRGWGGRDKSINTETQTKMSFLSNPKMNIVPKRVWICRRQAGCCLTGLKGVKVSVKSLEKLRRSAERHWKAAGAAGERLWSRAFVFFGVGGLSFYKKKAALVVVRQQEVP